MCGDVNSTSSTMPVTEVQWIGASCGRHSTYTFYRGFRLIVDGVVKNFCLGEFYFVRNSTDQPICIAELQLVWYDASTDSQLASARLYFRPEDTPAGRLANHGQDELLYADQKVVIKCHDMAVWQNSGLQWNCGMLPVCESDFVCVKDKYYLNSDYADKEKETLKAAREVWVERDHPRSLHILTFPAYCRYRALKKRLVSGMFLTRAQLVALGGIIAEHKNIRVLFCRDSFHHPSLDKFELSGDNKAPVLKGRPRKKKKLAAQSDVLKKKRFVADIQNHLENSPAAKRCKVSEGEESTSSDMSEGAQDKIRAPPAVGRKTKTNGPPPLIKPQIQVDNAERANIAEIPRIVAQDVPSAKGEHTKIPPPLIPSSKVKADVVCLSQPLQSSPKEINANISECSRTTPIQKQVFSSSTRLRDVENSLNIKKTVSLMKPLLTNRVRKNVAVIPASSPSSTPESRTSRLPNSLTEIKKTSNETVVMYTHNVDNTRTHPAVQADVHPAAVLSTRPLTTTQGTISSQSAASTCTVMRNQPVACLQKPISSVQSVPAKSLQNATPTQGPISSSVNIIVTKSRFSRENEEKFLRPHSVSEEKKENEMEESVMRKKKKKRLRMPGDVKDEVYEDDDEKFFMQTLRDFMRKNNQPLGKLPALGFKKVNLWTMYNTVQKFGGYDAVTGKRLWRRVYDSLGASTTITSAATYTKRHYERLLLPYERHIRNDLKRQMDEKNSPIGDRCAQREFVDKTKKKPGLTVSNSKAMQPSFHTDQAVVEKKQNQVIAKDRKTKDNIAPVSSQQAVPLKVTSTADVKMNVMHIAHSQEMQPAMTVSAVTSAPYIQGIPPVSVTSITAESKPWWKNSIASTEPLTTSSSDQRERTVAVNQFSQKVTVTQDRKQHHREGIGSHEETTTRTKFVYAKNTAAVDTNLNQAIPPQRISKVTNDDTQVVPPLQQLNTTNKGREIIDLTSEDSPPGVKSKSHTVPQTQRETQEISKVQRPIIGGGENARQRHFQQSQSKQDQNDSSKHHSTREHKPKVEGSIAYGVQPYSGQQFNNSSDPPHVHDSSPGLTTKKALDEVHPPLKQEGSHPKLDKKRHKQARLENLEGRYTHSPSSESVDEHFAEWLRRQSSGQQQHPKSNTRHHYTPELGQDNYTYVSEDHCPPDCLCSLSSSRKDEIRPPPPKPKKEHYEEELPFPSMPFYPGRWSPSSMMADRPDLYISSPSAHLQGPPDTLSSHLCTASRIFIPTPPMFTPPYHLGVAAMGGPALITGTENQLHIHPHCLLGSTYPGTSNSRTPEGTNYPLYSFT